VVKSSHFSRVAKVYFSAVKAFLLSRNAFTFCVFLFISASVWFVNSLDKEQSGVLKIPLRFAGIPQNVKVLGHLPEFLSLSIRDNGKQIIRYGTQQDEPIVIDLARRSFYERGEFLFTADQLRGQIARYLQPSTVVETITPDSITLTYEKLSSREIPVVASLSLELKRQYMLSEPVRIEPDAVTVFAPKRVVDTLQFLYTEQVTLKNISDTVLLEARLLPIEGVQFSAQTVRLRINVEEFTEKRLQLPVTVENCPRGTLIRTFPAMVELRCNVGFSYFNTLNASDVQAVLDYADIAADGAAKVKLKAKALVKHVSNLQLTPDEVEYIIENYED